MQYYTEDNVNISYVNMFIEWKPVISDNKNFLYNGCVHTM